MGGPARRLGDGLDERDDAEDDAEAQDVEEGIGEEGHGVKPGDSDGFQGDDEDLCAEELLEKAGKPESALSCGGCGDARMAVGAVIASAGHLGLEGGVVDGEAIGEEPVEVGDDEGGVLHGGLGVEFDVAGEAVHAIGDGPGVDIVNG